VFVTFGSVGAGRRIGYEIVGTGGSEGDKSRGEVVVARCDICVFA